MERPHLGMDPARMATASRSPRLPAVLAALALAVAAGVGYTALRFRDQAVVVRHRHAAVHAQATACASELAAERQRVEATVARAAETEVALEEARTVTEDTGQRAADLEAEVAVTRAQLEDLRRQREEAERRLAAFRTLTDKFKQMTDTGRLKVAVRKGRMIVKLPAEVLFASGKADLAPAGEAALRDVAAVLKELPDRHFVVAGHTDDLPLKASAYRSNWELSTARALRVTEFLISEGLSPRRLAAAGYGEFDPVRSNRTEAGRRENRRIEVQLVPALDELPPLPPELAAADEGDAVDEPEASAPRRRKK